MVPGQADLAINASAHGCLVAEGGQHVGSGDDEQTSSDGHPDQDVGVLLVGADDLRARGGAPCFVCDSTVNAEPPMPFGGVKASGWGRFGGKAALEEFTELRWITTQDSPGTYPI